MTKKISKRHVPSLARLTPNELAENMKQWFLSNSNETIGTLSKGTQPQENFFTEFCVAPIEHTFLDTFVSEMLTRQPHKRVLGCQAYRYLRIAVLAHLTVDCSQWPNYSV
jgi:hypothetical protein